MSLLPMLAAAGVWPAVPLTGFLVLSRTGGMPAKGTPPLIAFAVMTVAGLAVWSAPLLLSAIAGVYRPDYLGLVGWGVALFGLAAVLQRQKVIRQSATPTSGGRRARARVRTGRRASEHGSGTGGRHIDSAGWDAVLAAGLILVAVLYLGFPTESIYGGRDEGVYASQAIYLAHHGRLDVPYPWPDASRGIFWDAWVGFPGFYNTQPTMTVQFGHLFPLWLAQAFSTAGPGGLFRLNAVFAWLSLAVFYGVCRVAVAMPYAVIATVFLAFNPSQLWMARITLSEILTQLCIWGGLLLLLHALRDGRRALARWAGVFFGLSAFVRFDSLLVVPMLFLSQLAIRIAKEPTGKSPSVWPALYQTALPSFALAFGYFAVLSTPYLWERYYLGKLVLACVASFVMLLLSRPGMVKHLRPWLTHRAFLVVSGVGLLVLAAYAYWIRPLPTGPPRLIFQQPGFYQDLSKGDYRADSLVDLAQYLSPVVVWAAIAGWFVTLWTVVRGGRDFHLLAALVVIAGFSLAYLYDPLNTPDHFWWVRRFVPVVIPGFILSATLAARWALAKLSPGWSLAASVVALILLAVFTLRADTLILTFAENKGYFAQVAQLAQRLPRDELIVAHGYKTWVPPLFIAFDRRVVRVDLNSAKGKTAWKTWVAQQASQHKPAYLLVEVDQGDSRSSKVDEFVLSRSFSEPTVNPLPQKIMTQRIRIQLYTITEHADIEIH